MMATREDPVGDNLKATPGRAPSMDRSAGCRLPPLETLPCQESAAPATWSNPAEPASRTPLRP